MSTTFTIFGSRGRIGSHLVRYLSAAPGNVVHRDNAPLPSGNLGHVLFCIGVTQDLPSLRHSTMRAHVCRLVDVLESAKFDSFTYLSSTRVYERGDSGDEGATLSASPSEPLDYYKISKLAGEAVCLAHPNACVRVARLSHVVGFEEPPRTFVASLIRDALVDRRIVLHTALDSAKDYIGMDDVTRILPIIATHGTARIYNVTSGLQLRHRAIVDCIARTLGVPYEVEPGSRRSSFPETRPTKLQAEFGFRPESVIELLPALCRRYADVLKTA